MESIAIRGILANKIRRFEGLASAKRVHPLRQVVSPGISLPVATTPRGLFPFSLRGETIRLTTDLAQPGTVGNGVDPAERYDGLVWVIEARIVPGLGSPMPRPLQETGVFPVGYGALPHSKGAHPHPVHRLFILLPLLTAHAKEPRRDMNEFRLNDGRQVMRTED